MIINKIYLVTRNARDKVQLVIAKLEQNANSFTIYRTTGQYQGKMTDQPELLIERGKAKRSVLQQAELEFNSIVNKYLDKGYKRLDTLTKSNFEDITSHEMDLIVPTIKCDTAGFKKPMLAKSSNDCQNSVLQKLMYCSRKLNGVRMMMMWSEELQCPITVSRGGKNYNASTTHITKQLHDYLKANPTIVLDGELYHHGLYLQEISGIARLQEWEPRCAKLEYWIYDVANGELTFENRLEILENLKDQLTNVQTHVKVLDHVKTTSFNQIQKLHDEWVNEGFEGLVARKPDKTYQFGKRGSDMIKVKMYQDSEFKIIDYQDGLRAEDFCFICETAEGKPFAAKPIGDRNLKIEYMNNIDSIIGCMGVVKYFEISKDGIPQQPIFQAVRYTEDLPNKND